MFISQCYPLTFHCVCFVLFFLLCLIVYSCVTRCRRHYRTYVTSRIARSTMAENNPIQNPEVSDPAPANADAPAELTPPAVLAPTVGVSLEQVLETSTAEAGPTLAAAAPTPPSDQMSQFFSTLIAKFDEQRQEFCQFRSQFDEQRQELNSKFQDLNSRFDSKFCALDSRLDEHLTNFTLFQSEVSQQLNSVNSKVDKQSTKIASLASAVENNSTQISDINEHLTGQLKKCESLQSETVQQMTEFKDSINKDIATVSEKQLNLGHWARDKFKDNESEISNLKGEVTKKLKGVDNKIEGLHDSLNNKIETAKLVIQAQAEMERKEIEVKIDELEIKVAEKTISAFPVNAMPLSIPPNLKFSGNRGEQPITFLRNVENYFALARHIPESSKPKVIAQMLVDHAQEWFQTLLPVPADFQDFRSKFINRFWDRNTQYNFKMDLAKGRWDQNGNMSMRDYAVSRIAQLKQCEPTPPDDEIMWLLTRHYPYVIQNLLKTSFVKDLEQFQILLGDFDQTNVQFASYQNQSQNSSRPRNGNNNNQNRGFPPRHSQGQERPFNHGPSPHFPPAPSPPAPTSFPPPFNAGQGQTAPLLAPPSTAPGQPPQRPLNRSGPE